MMWALRPTRRLLSFSQIGLRKTIFFIPECLSTWKEEVVQKIKNVGFIVESMEDYKEKEYYSEEEVMDLIEMVPLVRDFNRKKDRKRISELAEKHKEKNGIKITWHYYIVEARRV